jgi:hypothetical protein
VDDSASLAQDAVRALCVTVGSAKVFGWIDARQFRSPRGAKCRTVIASQAAPPKAVWQRQEFM